jgi:endonuclease/exonuclease/phosphatase family metal-dependent hydrolase
MMVGDFNARPDAAELQPLLARFTDAWTMATAAPADNPDGLTSPAGIDGAPRNRIDYVFVSGSAKVRAVSVPIDAKTRLAADHYPIVVDVTLPSPPPSQPSR